MKNFKNLFLFLILVIVGLSSCRNENINVPLPAEMANTGKKLAFDPKPKKNDDVYIKLRDFKEKLRLFQSNSSLRDVQTMTSEQVVWNIEAYLNAAYGHTDKSFTGQSIRRDSFLVSITNGEVSGNDVFIYFSQC